MIYGYFRTINNSDEKVLRRSKTLFWFCDFKTI